MAISKTDETTHLSGRVCFGSQIKEIRGVCYSLWCGRRRLMARHNYRLLGAFVTTKNVWNSELHFEVTVKLRWKKCEMPGWRTSGFWWNELESWVRSWEEEIQGHLQYLPRKLLPRSVHLTPRHRGIVFVPEGNHTFFRCVGLRLSHKLRWEHHWMQEILCHIISELNPEDKWSILI